MLVLLGLSAASLLFVRRWPRLLLMASIVVYTVLMHATIYIFARLIFPVMPAIILLAAAGLTGLGHMILRGGAGEAAVSRCRR